MFTEPNNEVQTDSQITVGQDGRIIKHRKRVLTPPGKPVPKEEGDSITPKGKNIKTAPDGVFGMFKVYFDEGGPMPSELRGLFTSKSEAQKAINLYLNNYKY